MSQPWPCTFYMFLCFNIWFRRKGFNICSRRSFQLSNMAAFTGWAYVIRVSFWQNETKKRLIWKETSLRGRYKQIELILQRILASLCCTQNQENQPNNENEGGRLTRFPSRGQQQSLTGDNKHKVRRFLNYLPRLSTVAAAPYEVVLESGLTLISALIATCHRVYGE